jgi:uncharacterized membrane protein
VLVVVVVVLVVVLLVILGRIATAFKAHKSTKSCGKSQIILEFKGAFTSRL